MSSKLFGIIGLNVFYIIESCILIEFYKFKRENEIKFLTIFCDCYGNVKFFTIMLTKSQSYNCYHYF